MFGTLSDEIEVKVPASEAWKVYGTLQLADVVREQLPDVVQEIQVLEGDGSQGTKLKLTFPHIKFNPTQAQHLHAPSSSFKEEFVVVDDQNRIKVTEVFEGGFLDLGFTLYRVTFQVFPNPNDQFSCTTKATIEYQLDDDAAANVSLVTIRPLTAIMKAAANYLHTRYPYPYPAPAPN